MVSLEWAVCPVHCTIHGSLTHQPVRRREQTAVTIAKSPMSTGRTGNTAQTAVNIQRSLKTGPVTPLSKTNISLLIITLLMQKRTATVFKRSQPVMSCEDRLNSQSSFCITMCPNRLDLWQTLLLLSRCGCQQKCSTLKAKVKLSVPPCLYWMKSPPWLSNYILYPGCYLYVLFVQVRGAKRFHRCWEKRNMCLERQAVTPAVPKHTQFSNRSVQLN